MEKLNPSPPSGDPDDTPSRKPDIEIASGPPDSDELTKQILTKQIVKQTNLDDGYSRRKKPSKGNFRKQISQESMEKLNPSPPSGDPDDTPSRKPDIEIASGPPDSDELTKQILTKQIVKQTNLDDGYSRRKKPSKGNFRKQISQESSDKLNRSLASLSLDDTPSRRSDADRPSDSSQLRKLTAERRRRSLMSKNQIVRLKCTNLDDGYSWMKYDQKEIFGSKYPRVYFRCANSVRMGCFATKQIQQDDYDPITFHVTCVGAHTCHQHELQTSPNKAQEVERHSLQSAAVLDFGKTTSHERSKIKTDLTKKSEQYQPSRAQYQPSRAHVASGRTPAAMMVASTGLTNDMMMDQEVVVSLLLQSDSNSEHNVCVVSVVGAEGAGKTTLARLAYDDPMVCEAFQLRSWVCLARVDNVEDLLRAMIKSLTTLSCHPSEQLSELQEIVKEEVTSRKYLLVLDNLWDVQILESELLASLMFCRKGSKILVTAKEELDIGTTLWMRRFYKLNDMSEDVCWRIMKECAFYDRDSSAFPGITEVGQMMLPACGGNPLAARAIGGLLRAKVYDPSISSYFLNSVIWEPQKKEINICRALGLSYRFLPEFLKKCLVYCSLFPKGYVFEKSYLIRLWMAQGYIQPQDKEEEEEEEEDIGSAYLDELHYRSFLQRSQDPNFTGQCYEMHDVVYNELQQTISWKEAFQTKDYKKVHIVSFISDKSRSSNDFALSEEGRDSQSLLIDRHLLEYSGRKKIQALSPTILSDVFDNLLHLKALDLRFSNIKELPNSIGKLQSLGYLGLNNTNVRKLPASLCNLYNLQTLELQDCAYLQNLPQDINKLINLRHLDTRKKSGFVGIPNGIGKLSKLQTLSAFSVAEEEEWHSSGISELKNLVNLRGDICIGGLRHVTDDKEVEEAQFHNKEGLESLTLQWSTSAREIEGDEMDGKAEKVFESLQPHRKLKQLIVRDYCGDQFPRWIVNPSLYKLISITLDNCRWCKKLPPLGQITPLKHLFIRRMDSVQSVGREFLGCGELSAPAAFPSLETLKIWDMYNLEEWNGVKVRDFPCLQSVSISKCFKLLSLPSLRSLVELTIHHGAELPALSNLESLRSLSIEGFHSLSAFILQPGLSSVLRLEVKNCSQLSSLRGLKNSKTLREIKLDKCPVLDLESDELPLTLEVVDIHHSCSLLTNWVPAGFHENSNFGEAIRRRLMRRRGNTFRKSGKRTIGRPQTRTTNVSKLGSDVKSATQLGRVRLI